MIGKRIVLFDVTETGWYAELFGAGLGQKIWSLQGLTPDQILELQNLGPGDGVLLIGGEPFKFIKERYHVGVRNENYADCSKLQRLSMEGGAYAKVILDPPTNEEKAYFMSDDFTREVTFPNWSQCIIHTYADAMQFLDWIDSLPLDTCIGFDYEASGMPLDKWFEVSGYSFSTLERAGFISLTDIRHELGVSYTETSENEQYNILRQRTADILFRRMKYIITYNMAYEYQVSHRMLFGVDLYNLSDASVINVLSGNHLKKYSLKWSAQYYLKVPVWDSDFDRLSDLIDSMLFETVGKLKADKHKVLRVSQSDFEQTDEWKTLCNNPKYAPYIPEFRRLILEYWGNAFMCIPSEILGYYCNLDARNTVAIFEQEKKNYSEDAIETFMDNARLSVRLGNGLYIDENYRKAYSDYSQRQMAIGITYCALARCFMKMEKHKAKAANPKNYSPLAIKLLEEGKFFGGDGVEIAKWLLAENLDHDETSKDGVNWGSIALKMGQNFTEKFMEILHQGMTEIKFKGKIDEGIVRKKKLLGIAGEAVSRLLGIGKLKLGPRHEELEKYMYYERVYKELYKVSHRQLADINNVPGTIHAFGRNWPVLEYADYVSENFFKCKSPLENNEIAYEYTELYKHQTAYLTAMYESTQQLPDAEKFYSNRGITDINVGFNEFMDEWQNFFKGTVQIGEDYKGRPVYVNNYHSKLYPDKVFNLALEHYQSPKKIKDQKKSAKTGKPEYEYYVDDKTSETWTDFAGYKSQAQFFPEFNKQFTEYSKPFEPEDYTNDFFFMRKFTLNYLLFKKYSKVESTYVGETGMLKKTAKWVIEDNKHIPIREADPNEPGAVSKLFIHYEVQTKSSKRWSSPFHTIISHSDLKNAICVPPSWDENGNIQYGGSDFLMTYFDISSAEVNICRSQKKFCELLMGKIGKRCDSQYRDNYEDFGRLCSIVTHRR